MIKYNTAGGQIDRFNKGIPLFVPELIHVLSALANYDFGVNPKTCRQCSPNFWGAQSCIVIFEAFFIPTCPLVHHCHGTRELGIRLDPLVMSITTPTQDVQKSFNMCSLTLCSSVFGSLLRSTRVRATSGGFEELFLGDPRSGGLGSPPIVSA